MIACVMPKDDELSRTLSTRIKDLLSQADLNETELADKSGVPQPTVNRLVTGKIHDPRLRNIHKLAKFFKVPMGYLLGEESAPSTVSIISMINWDLLQTITEAVSGHPQVKAGKYSENKRFQISAEVYEQLCDLDPKEVTPAIINKFIAVVVKHNN